MTAQGEADRVQVAAHHWRPRFVANGIDVNDFDSTVAGTTSWSDWGPRWRAVGEMHEALADEAEQRGRHLSAAAACQRAAWCYHLGKFLWFEQPDVHAELRDRSVSIYRRALPHLDPPAERLEIPFEGRVIPANLRRAAAVDRPPLVQYGSFVTGLVITLLFRSRLRPPADVSYPYFPRHPDLPNGAGWRS